MASHAQKYFMRRSKTQEQKKRKNIHDTTHPDINMRNSTSFNTNLAIS